jgi:hypothetical protein
LRDVLQCALAADRNARFRDASEFARQLDLCLQPRKRDLLFPPPGWRTWVRRHPLLAIYPVGLISNLVASIINISYNHAELVSHYPNAESSFRLLQLIVNGAFYPLGVILFGLFIWPVAMGLRRARKGPLTDGELARLRRHTLRLGAAAVAVCLSAWVVSGIVFPLALHLMVQELPGAFHLHFLVSQTLCGLIAVTYPLFAVTFVAVRAIYPVFCPSGKLPAADGHHLKMIEKAMGWCLVIAASVPMLAVGLLAGIRSANYTALGVLSLIGVVGLAVAYVLTAEVRADVAALTE